MKVTEIVVSAGRVVNHPFEQYSNLRPSITLKASLDEGEDFETATKQLQAKAEQLVEDHKNNMLTSIEELHMLTERQREVASLESSIKRAQSQLDRIRAETPQLQLGGGHNEQSEGPDW
jgi:hypothetical protein